MPEVAETSDPQDGAPLVLRLPCALTSSSAHHRALSLGRFNPGPLPRRYTMYLQTAEVKRLEDLGDI